MAYINIEVDLDDFDLNELLDEVERRYDGYRSSSSDKETIKEFCLDIVKEGKDIYIGSLTNEMKFDFLRENIDKIGLNDLENLLQS